MGEMSLTAVGIFAFITAVLMGLGLWMLAVEGRATGLLPIAFALFNLAVGIFSFQGEEPVTMWIQSSSLEAASAA